MPVHSARGEGWLCWTLLQTPSNKSAGERINCPVDALAARTPSLRGVGSVVGGGGGVGAGIRAVYFVPFLFADVSSL